ncbi:MAG: malate dehydrogenase [Gammaproteobacteria bacterium]|uniref:Malate dehydrogenase n=1 Tax=Candidatus Thiopontia autotrophica TaxID=2841688 RepID=A0A8J6NVH1_9GAMM|nr:malate dehydrogenase [Candidatus Thiopontia autotrophica]
MNKISIVGAGRVGEATAHLLAVREHAREVVLIDISEGAASGTALDIQETAPILGFDTKLTGSDDPSLMAGSEVVVITAGVPRKPGMSRSDVLETNLKVIDGIVGNVVKHAPDAIIIMVTNPVDVLTYHAWKSSGWDRSRVIGQAGVLDSMRMASFVSMETGFSIKDINAMVLGGHGDTMVPLPRFTTINGIPVRQFIDEEPLQQLIQRTRDGGAEILALKQNSSAYDAPGAAVAEMISAMSMNRRRILPCVAILDGEYGQSDIAMGVPVVLGQSGMESVVELDLDREEMGAFSQSAEMVLADLQKI